MSLPKLPLGSSIGSPHTTSARLTCPYCLKSFKSGPGRDRHIILQPRCRARHLYVLSGKKPRKRKRRSRNSSTEAPNGGTPAKRMRTDEDPAPIAGPSTLPIPSRSMDEDLYSGGIEMDASDRVFVERYPISTAGAPIGNVRRSSDNLPEYLSSCGPLGDRDLFRTAEILMTTGLTGRGRTKHLEGPLYKGKTPWKDNAALLRDVDRLPSGPEWTTAEVTSGEGRYKRTHIVYLRDILQVVRELIGASRFKSCLRYAPERRWTSKHRNRRVYGEMWSGDWWWRMQGLIRNQNGTIVPLIIATDETTLTNNPKGPKGYPVYLSIGNISKNVRRRPSKRAMVVVGYLPVDAFEDVVDENARKLFRGELLHRSLGKVFEPLKTASEEGMLTWCADGYLRHVYPIIAAWIADWPEQNDIACTVRSGCPKCMQKWKGRGLGRKGVLMRSRKGAIEAFSEHQQATGRSKLNTLGLKPWSPFWIDIPHVDVGMGLAPDLLHQLYKGMFEHARDWVEDLLGTQEFNRRFKSMPPAKDLRHFKKGVTTVKLWAGRESREMMRQFLPVVIDAQAPVEFVQLIRALLDFSYLAHSEQLTDTELIEMDNALALFHRAKYQLVKMDIVAGPSAFDRIPKLHMLGHYTQSIRDLGTPDGYSTETPEHLHIIYVKNGWRMSNRRNPIPQIVKYVQRLEAIQIQRTFIDEYYGDDPKADSDDPDMYGDNEDDIQCDAELGDIDDDENDDDEESIAADPEEANSYYESRYPRPAISIARQPTVPHVSGRVLISSYGASDLVRALTRFLAPKARSLGEQVFVLPSDSFDVWHKASLTNTALPFASNIPLHRDVIRVRPLVRDAASRIRQEGAFDTALFAANREECGLLRFRAGRVRAIFTLPARLHHLYSGPLVYLEIFNAFKPDKSNSHRMYSTSQAYSDNGCAALVLPLRTLTMACHLAPNFSVQPSPSGVVNHYFFNDFYNHFTHLLIKYWHRPSPP